MDQKRHDEIEEALRGLFDDANHDDIVLVMRDDDGKMYTFSRACAGCQAAFLKKAAGQLELLPHCGMHGSPDRRLQ